MFLDRLNYIYGCKHLHEWVGRLFLLVLGEGVPDYFFPISHSKTDTSQERPPDNTLSRGVWGSSDHFVCTDLVFKTHIFLRSI